MENKLKLNNNEISILKQLANGISQKSIAERLGLSRYTIGKRVKTIAIKLHAQNITHAVCIATCNGCI